MTATPARIGFIIHGYRLATSGPDATVVSHFGAAARDTDTPIDTFFVNVADAKVMSDERLALLKGNRRRFSAVTVDIQDLSGDLAPFPQTPAAHVIDTVLGADLTAAIVEYGVDYEKAKTTFVCWG